MISRFELTVSAIVLFGGIALLSYASLLTMRAFADVAYKVFFKG